MSGPKEEKPSPPGRDAPRVARPCPVCGKPSVEKWRPFCSKRCADVDLNRWLGGHYRIETDEAPDPSIVPEDPKE